MEVLLTKKSLQQSTLMNPEGKNKFREVEFSSGMVLTEFLIDSDRSNTFRLGESKQDALTLIYNFAKSVEISCFNCNTRIKISTLNNILILNRKSNYIDFHLKAHNTYQVTVIEVPHNSGNLDLKKLYSKFTNSSKQFQLFNKGKVYAHSSPNIEITENIKELWELEKKSLYNRLLSASLVTIILVLKLKEYNKTLKYSNLKNSNLTANEIEKIYLIKDEILNFPEEDFTLDYFCKKYNFNVQKLQTGFKSLYGKTVGTFIKYIRIKKAEELMRTTNMNISEIVYTIGFSSRSYFSKIFKETYNCSPKKYLKNLTKEDAPHEM